MKQYLSPFALCLTLACSASALAASSTDVSVTGMITPAACTPSLSGAGRFDFGKISAQDLNQDTHTDFKSGMQRLTIACSAPTRFAIDGIDNRAGTVFVADGAYFGLGLNGTEKIGGFKMGIQPTGLNADGDTAVQRLMSLNGGAWIPAPAVASIYNRGHAGNNILIGFAVQNGREPSPISTLSADLQVTMSITRARDLTLIDDINIDGSASIEVNYL